MDFDYLFYSELPSGIKSVYVNGKRMTIKEFNKISFIINDCNLDELPVIIVSENEP